MVIRSAMTVLEHGAAAAPFTPTEEHRRTARVMAGFGLPESDIAVLLGIDTATLRQHVTDEMDRGVAEARAKMSQTLFQMATVDKNVSALIFWMKARAGWSEKTPPPGEDGGTIVWQVVNYADVADTRPPLTTLMDR